MEAVFRLVFTVIQSGIVICLVAKRVAVLEDGRRQFPCLWRPGEGRSSKEVEFCISATASKFLFFLQGKKIHHWWIGEMARLYGEGENRSRVLERVLSVDVISKFWSK